MIRLVCPACNRPSDRAKIKLTIEVFGYMRPVPGRDSGVERAISSPLQVGESPLKPNVVPDGSMTCGRCGADSPMKTWKYSVSCDSCGNLLTAKPVSDPSDVVDEYLCRDSMSVYCNDCWSRVSKEYCENCRFGETCSSYNNR